MILPPDTRKAGLESPFYGWWFSKNLGSDIKLDEVGPLLQRLGIRRTALPDEMPESQTLAKYGFTNSTVPWFRKGSRGYQARKNSVAEGVAMHEEFIRKYLELWPSIDRMLVFHESGAVAQFPKEVYGETPPPPEEKAVVHWQDRIDYLTALSQMVREKFPQLKLQYGNDGNSMNLIGEIFRHKFPAKYMDTISSESLGQTLAPERNSLGGIADGYYLRELASKMGYDVPVTACTEWTGRMTEKLGRKTQAEWKVRDGLLALAYGYDTISIAGINDAGNGYYFSPWANGGLNERYPIMAPKPAYAAVATLTQVLDQAKFQRFVPTGSTVCYLQEFQRGPDWVYAAWTPRGLRELTLNFPADAKRPLIDLYGRESNTEGKTILLPAGTAVQYVVSKDRLTSALVGASSFPEDLANVPERPLKTIPLESLEVINIGSNQTRQKQTAAYDLGKMIEGNFEIREVNDPEMGACVEVELKPGRELRLGEVEYVYLALKEPITTLARNAGVWIKGNGSWGDVNVQKSGWGPWADNGNIGMSWPGDASMNFEGWNFILYPFYDWVHFSGDETVVVNGIWIAFPRQTLVGTEMKPVENQKVRIKSIVLF